MAIHIEHHVSELGRWRLARIIPFRRALDLVIERSGPLAHVALEAGCYRCHTQPIHQLRRPP